MQATQTIRLTDDLAMKFPGTADRLYLGHDRAGGGHHCYRQPYEPLTEWVCRATEIQARFAAIGYPLRQREECA